MLTGVLEQELIYAIYCGIAVGFLMVFSGLAQMLSRREGREEAKSRRMRMIAAGRNSAELLAVLKPTQQKGILHRLPLYGDLSKTLLQAGIIVQPAKFLFSCMVLFLVLLGFGITLLPPYVAFGAAAVTAFVCPIAIMRYMREQKMTKLLHQLPDALDLMARGLRVGHPLNTSIGAVAREMPDPIGTEFGIVFDQVNFGDDLTDAIQELAERVDIEDVNYFAASIGIQHGTGGDLATVIQTLARVIRGRISMRRKILAISSEGRLTCWFLSALPVVIFSFTSASTPQYYGGVFDDPLFKPMAIAVVAFTILNFLILRKLVRFRI